MNVLHKEWFSELSDLWPGQCFSIKIKSHLHSEQSQYQKIDIFESESFGTVLVLDGIIQCTERDEFAYQEMISFIPLCCHTNPKKVLIVGGGDGGVAREVIKHPLVDEVHQVEIDDRVIELSRKFLPNMAKGFDSPKVKLTIGDGFEYMKQREGEFDVIITDSSDPVGPACSLFQEPYFKLLKRALKANGIICSQGGTYWTEMDLVKNTMDNARAQFSNVYYAVASVPTYPNGQIGFIIATDDSNLKPREPRIKFNDEEIDQMELKYYTSENHGAAFTLPRFAEKMLKTKT